MKGVLMPLLFLAVAASLSAQRPARPGPHLLVPGSPFGGDTTGVEGATWFGVYRSPTGWQLRPARVKIAHGEFGCFDTQVQTADSLPPMFLLDLPGLRAGPIDTVFTGYRVLYPGESVSWRLRAGWFVIRAGGTVTPQPTTTQYTGYTLDLGSTIDRYQSWQHLVKLDFSADNMPKLRWGGDVDGDGKLDLILQLPTGGYSSQSVLYLSSSARGADLLAPVGEFEVTDC